MSGQETDTDGGKERKVLTVLNESGPIAKEDIAWSVGFDEETTKEVVRRLLYSGRVTTNSDWEFVATDETED